MASKPFKAIGDDAWRTKMDKVNGELFVLTYGAIVSQLCHDLDHDYSKVNEQLDKMGYNIGSRLIEEFLSKSQLHRCRDFRETAEAIAKVGFKMFLNIVPMVKSSPDGRSFSLILDENPLSEFVELPLMAKGQSSLWFSNMLCGVVRGALEMVQLQCQVHWISDTLHGHEHSEIHVTLLKVLEDEVPPGED